MQKKLPRLLALVLVFAMCLTMVPLVSAAPDANLEEIPEALYLALDPLWDDIAEAETNALSAQHIQSVEKADLSAIAQVVTASEYYVPGSLQWQGDSRFTFDTTVGIPCVYSARLREQSRNAVPNPELAEQPDTQVIEYGKKGASSKDVYVIGPYYGLDDSFTNQYQNEGQSVAQALGGTYTLYKTTSATIDNVAKAIESGAVVFFDSHGDTNWVNPDDEYDYATGAVDSYLLLQSGTGITSADYQDEHAVYGGSYGSMRYYMVDGVAITNHMAKDAGDCLVWMAICLGMATDGLNKPLRERGVDVVYGYSQSVTFDGDYCFETTFWNQMKSGSTVAQAIAQMKDTWGCWDCSPQIGEYNEWEPYECVTTLAQAKAAYCAFPIVVSDEDAYPGHGNVDDYQTVLSSYTLFDAYQVTALSADETKGTVSVSGNTVTATPATGYYASGYSLSPADAATVTQDGNRFVLSNLTADCTITIRFDAKTPAVVCFQVPDGVTQPQISGYVSDSILLPTPSGTPTNTDHDYTFLGWAEKTVSPTTEKPTFYRAGEEYTIRADSLLYALYAYSEAAEGSSSVFEQVVADRDDWSAEYVILGGSQVLDASAAVTGTQLGSVDGAVALTTAGITLSDKTLNSVTDDYVYVVSPVSGSTAYTIRMKNSDNYLSCSKSSNMLDTTTDPTDPHAHWKLTMNSGAVSISNVYYPARYLRYNNSSKVFRCYTSGQEAVTLYASSATVRYYVTLSSQPAHEHNYTREAVPPSCTERGYTTYTCSGCGDSYVSDYVDALGHKLGEWSEIKAATCTEKGEECRSCARCPYEESREVGPLGHDWDDGTVTTEPTYTEEGVKTFCCSRCDATYTEAILVLQWVSPFTDVKEGAWYYEAVKWANINGIVNGTSDTTFSPLKKADRAMLVTTLWRMAGSPEVEFENPFADVKESAWYHEAVMWAAKNGIVTGKSANAFKPNDLLTREQAASILYRYAEALGLDTSATADLTAFPDGAHVSEYAVPAMQWAVANGLINGNKIDGVVCLDARGTANRGQIAIILMNFSKLISE